MVPSPINLSPPQVVPSVAAAAACLPPSLHLPGVSPSPSVHISIHSTIAMHVIIPRLPPSKLILMKYPCSRVVTFPCCNQRVRLYQPISNLFHKSQRFLPFHANINSRLWCKRTPSKTCMLCASIIVPSPYVNPNGNGGMFCRKKEWRGFPALVMEHQSGQVVH